MAARSSRPPARRRANYIIEKSDARDAQGRRSRAHQRPPGQRLRPAPRQHRGNHRPPRRSARGVHHRDAHARRAGRIPAKPWSTKPAKAKPAPAPREDLTRIPLITIDPEDARDHDDAVYAEPDGHGGWRVIVAIADVAAYVRIGTIARQGSLSARQLHLLPRPRLAHAA